MTTAVPTATTVQRIRRAGTIAATTLALSMLAAPAALAAPPQHTPSVQAPIEFAAGQVCSNALRFENTALRGKDTAFAPSRDGSTRVLSRGYGASLVTNLDTGATYTFAGGVQFTFNFSADGSLRVDAHGRDFVAWYFPGDDAELGPGVFQLNGRLTEWYGPDGTFIRSTYSGKATDLCAMLGG